MIMLLGKTKLDTTEVLISKTLINSYIRHDEFLSVNNLLGDYNEIKEKRKNPETSVECFILKQWKPIVSVARKIVRTTIQVFQKLNKID